MVGCFKNGHPSIQVEVYGFSKSVSHKIDAMIDTGFSGFLMLPMAYAFKLGLILHSISSFVLADGSVSPSLLCLGTIVIDNAEIVGLIGISEGNDILIGIDFLRKLKKSLYVNCNDELVKIG